MGWRRALQNLGTIAQEVQEAGTAEGELDRQVGQLKSQIQKFEEEFQRDIINANNLRFNEEEGLTSDPINFETGAFSGTAKFPTVTAEEAKEYRPEPNIYEVEDAFVEALGFFVAPWCSLLALKVGHSNPAGRIRCDWVIDDKREESRVYLIDPENNEYYYPSATDLRGEVVASRPRTGLIAFPPFRKPTDKVEIHFSNVILASEASSDETFYFEYTEPGLSDSIQRHIEKPSIGEKILKHVKKEEDRIRQELQASSGCSVALMLLAGSVVGVVTSLISFT